jgi:hypothetical protein
MPPAAVNEKDRRKRARALRRGEVELDVLLRIGQIRMQVDLGQEEDQRGAGHRTSDTFRAEAIRIPQAGPGS